MTSSKGLQSHYQFAPYSGQGATVFNVCPPEFWSCSGPVVFVILLLFSFITGLFTLCHYIMEECNTFLSSTEVNLCFEFEALDF